MTEGSRIFSRWGRLLAPILSLLLAAPAVGMLLAPPRTASPIEHRRLAPPPSVPHSLTDWLALPDGLSAYVRDHFWGREALIMIDLKAQAHVGLKLSAEADVVRGKGDWLFLEPGLPPVTGGQVKAPVAARYAAFVCALAAQSRARGSAFLFAPAPGSAEIYPEALPDWLPRGRPTQPDLVVKAVQACGVAAVDLRPSLLAAKPLGSLYMHHDTHWTDLAALIAFDATAKALGKSWNFDPRALTWRARMRPDLDLERLSGELALGPERILEPVLPSQPAAQQQPLDLNDGPNPPPFMWRMPRAGLTVLIVGDSFTQLYMPKYFQPFVRQFAWTNQNACRLDPALLDRVKPDIVLLMPVSRSEVCAR